MRTVGTAKKKIAGSAFLQEAELRLREERQTLKSALSADSPEELTQQLNEPGSASEDEIREVEYAHRDVLQQRLRNIQEALERFKSGEYGTCTRCGTQITLRRLAFDPAVALCIGCQQTGENDIAAPTL